MSSRPITSLCIAIGLLLSSAAYGQYYPRSGPNYPYQQTPVRQLVPARADTLFILYDGETQFTAPIETQVDDRVVRERDERMLRSLHGRLLPSNPTGHFEGFTLRTNALYLLATTLNAGVGWESEIGLGVIVSGAWAGWQMDIQSDTKRYKMWLVSPEVRYYFGARKRLFAGVAGYIGQFNVKFKEGEAFQGDLLGGGVTLGYRMQFTDRFGMEFSLGGGYADLRYESYTIQNGYDMRGRSDLQDGYFGPTNAGITLVWKIR